MTNFNYYYKYNFVSPEGIFALIREELKSYLDTGAVDDVLWSIYLDKCLKKLNKGMLQIIPTILDVCNSQARLPDNFSYVREAWLCTDITKVYQLPAADYQEVQMSTTSTLLKGNYSYCAPCGNCNEPDVIKAVYKTTHQAFAYYHQEYLLKPGNVHTFESCYQGSPNKHATALDTFDIHGNKFVTNFTTGTVYLLYYAKTYDEVTGYQMVPDNFRIMEYIELFIKQKVFEQLSNQIVDETYNQIQQKAEKYKQMADEAFVIADIESKKDTIFDKHRKTIREKQRFNKYLINW